MNIKSHNQPQRKGARKPAAKGSARKSQAASAAEESWTFLSNHSHVLVCLAQDPDQVLREVAAKVGITERAVQRIVADLERAGILERERDGRRNRYRMHLDAHLRHPLEQHCRIGELLDLVIGPQES
ncbi:MAG: winged helix-turn-helix domain-containing protein [Gammaproteobacteria bacterium]